MTVRLYASMLLLGLVGAHAGGAENLFVFFPTTVRPHVLQKGLAGPDLVVTAFGRFADFEEVVKAKPPEAILSFPEVIGNLEGYKVAVTGKRGGETQEPYFLVGVEKAIDPAHLAGDAIGSVDFLGRKGMQKFMAGIFQPAPALKTVTKVEDLLPLLTFKMVEGVLATQAQVDYFRSVSRLNFVVTPVPNAKAGTLCLAVRKGAQATKSIQALRTIDADLRKLLGDVQWD
jgi:hypothetical protein